MNKENVVHIHIEILVSHRKNEVLSSVPSRIKLEVAMLSEICEAQKGKYHRVSLIWSPENGYSHNLKYNHGYQMLRREMGRVG